MASMWNAQLHSYEEIREIVVDTLLNRTPHQWEVLLTEVATGFTKRSGQHGPNTPPLHPHDSELVRDRGSFGQTVSLLAQLSPANPTPCRSVH